MEFEDFNINDIVRHETFGIGHVEQLSIDDHTIFVIFEDGYSTWFSELFGVANHTIDTLTIIHKADEPEPEPEYPFWINSNHGYCREMTIKSNRFKSDYGENYDDFIDAIRYFVEKIEDEEGENNMEIKNEVLKLYEERKRKAILNEYEEKEREFMGENALVKKYNSILAAFEEQVDELVNSEENITSNVIIEQYSQSLYKYGINHEKLSDDFIDEYIEERDKKLHDLAKEIAEINAQLSLSDNLEYQLEILVRYGILDKKTKKMVD